MKKLLPLIVVVIVAVVAVVAVVAHGNNNSPSYSNSSTSSSKTSSSSSTSAVATDTVAISDYKFSPANITVKVGTTVTWTNKDAVGHTVTETDSQTGPNSPDMNQNQTYSYTFKTAGTYHYDCSIHPYMVGTVTVTN